MSADPDPHDRHGLPGDILTVTAYTAARPLSRQRVWRLIREQRLPAYRVGASLFVSLAEADAALFTRLDGHDGDSAVTE